MKSDTFAYILSGSALVLSSYAVFMPTHPGSIAQVARAAVPAALSSDAVWAAIMKKPDMLGELAKAYQISVADATRVASVQAVDAALPEIFRSTDPVLGKPSASRRIAVFFDYQCPHCREAEPALRKAVLDDPSLAVVMREFPVLGSASVLASRAALAANLQGLYMPMHDALLEQPLPLTAEKIADAARSVGVDLVRMNLDMASDDIRLNIETTLALGRKLDIQGTPSFVGKSVGFLAGYGNDTRFSDFIAHVKAD